jgi:hypothetical protein
VSASPPVNGSWPWLDERRWHRPLPRVSGPAGSIVPAGCHIGGLAANKITAIRVLRRTAASDSTTRVCGPSSGTRVSHLLDRSRGAEPPRGWPRDLQHSSLAAALETSRAWAAAGALEASQAGIEVLEERITAPGACATNSSPHHRVRAAVRTTGYERGVLGFSRGNADRRLAVQRREAATEALERRTLLHRLPGAGRGDRQLLAAEPNSTGLSRI